MIRIYITLNLSLHLSLKLNLILKITLALTRNLINIVQIFSTIKIVGVGGVDWTCVGNTSNLPRRFIALSPLWKFETAGAFIQLQAEINIKGPNELGNGTWNNSTISLYSTDCTKPYYWIQHKFTSSSSNTNQRKMKYLINSKHTSCQVRKRPHFYFYFRIIKWICNVRKFPKI